MSWEQGSNEPVEERPNDTGMFSEPSYVEDVPVDANVTPVAEAPDASQDLMSETADLDDEPFEDHSRFQAEHEVGGGAVARPMRSAAVGVSGVTGTPSVFREGETTERTAPPDEEVKEEEASESPVEFDRPARTAASRLYRVERVAKPVVPEGETKPVGRGDRVDLGQVVSALNRGETLQYTILRRTQGGEVEHLASRPLTPDSAKKRELSEDDQREGSAGQEAADFRYSTRIVGVRRAANENSDEPTRSAEDDDLPFRIQGLLGRYNGPFKLTMQAEGVPQKQVADRLDEIEEQRDNERDTRGRTRQAADLSSYSDELTEASTTALARRSIVVSAPDIATLEAVANDIASSVLKSDDKTAWVIEAPQGDEAARSALCRVYNSEEAALAAGQDDRNSYVSAQTFAERVRYPREPVPGLDVREQEIFDVHRHVPPDKPSVRLGSIVDNEGYEAGELRALLEDINRHSGIFGSSGGGKSEAMKQLATVAAAMGVPVVLVDQEKVGNYNDLGGRMTGMGVPAEDAIVRRITAGGDGVPANINLLDPIGTTPSEQVSIATNALASSLRDPEAYRVFAKYVRSALRMAYEQMGWDMDMDKSNYPHGTPPLPDMSMVAQTIKYVIENSDFQANTKGDLGGFTQGQYKSMLEGVPGKLFQGGYDIDWRQVLSRPGVTIIELKRLTSPEAKRVALTGIMRGLAGACDDLKQSLGIEGDAKEVFVMLGIDEASGAFSAETPSGRDNAHFFTHMRGRGMAATLALTGLEDVDPKVINNLLNKIAGQMNSQKDIDILASAMGNVTPDKLGGYLNTVTPGNFMYYGSGMKGPVRLRIDHPDSLPIRESRIVGPEELVKRGHDPELYDKRIREEAHKFLEKTPLGNLIIAWAEINTILAVSGHPLMDVRGKLLEKLTSMEGDRAQIRDRAITEAITAAVYARPQIMNLPAWEQLIGYLQGRMLRQVNPEVEKPQASILSLTLDYGYYSRVKDRIVNEMTARALPETAEFEKYLGEGELAGDTAVEQRANVSRLERVSKKAIVDFILTRSKVYAEMELRIANKLGDEAARLDILTKISQLQEVEPEWYAAMQKVGDELAQGVPKAVVTKGSPDWNMPEHVGRSLTIAAAETAKLLGSHVELGIEDRIALLRSQVVESLGHELDTAEQHAFEAMVGISDVAHEWAWEYNYRTLRARIEAAIEERLHNTPAVDLSRLERLYGEQFVKAPPEEPVTYQFTLPERANSQDKAGAFLVKVSVVDGWAKPTPADATIHRVIPPTAQEQLDDILEREKKLLEESPYEVTLNNILLALDYEHDGFKLENMVARLFRRRIPKEKQGDIFDRQERAYNNGKELSLALIDMFRRGDERADKWGQILSEEVIYSPNFRVSAGSKRFLVDAFNILLANLRTNAKKHGDKKKQNEETN